MKATGIVRRLDDLGRLVIPKEIRKLYRLKEGDSIEFFVSDDSQIILQKFSALSEGEEEIEVMCSTLAELVGNPVFFVQTDAVMCVGNSKYETYKEYVLTKEFQEAIKVYHHMKFPSMSLFIHVNLTAQGLIYPVVINGDWLGAFILLQESKEIEAKDMDMVQVISRLLTRQKEH